ncbi:hypothetical protein HZS55_22170 [Halosimplex rubrum]|uniref:Uncharacterized protein n=1 Tax=Halosimplex rubrum TaxID=869889 RepID=A0A7D5T9M8_9EURY|nr:hypothetical protein [Halosimplex rubrum]QLH79835.1 hypothetical protein HZS55_22170 [Halosimplex rubrum]
MRRRDFCGVLGSAALAGCGGLLDTGPDSNPDSRFAGEPCTSAFGGDATCYHGVANRNGDLVLVPDREQVPAPSEPVAFTLENGLNTGVRVSLTFPRVYRLFEGRWFRLPDRRQDQGGSADLGEGESMRFGLANGRGSIPEDVDWGAGKAYGAGQFAYGVWASNPDVLAVARFVVDGESMTLSPPGDAKTTRSGSAIEIRDERFDERDHSLTTTFSARPNAEETVAVPPEVCHGQWELRCIACLRREGVSTVRVHTEDRGFFRTPLGWLDAAGAPTSDDTVYEVGPTAFTVTERSV